MRTNSVQKRGLAAATRGLIVQRVLVDRCTPEQAGAPFGIDGEIVALWVAAYRRHGMAALRDEAGIKWTVQRWLGDLIARLTTRRRRDAAEPGTARPDAGRSTRVVS
jgi:hypothetical protein